MPLMTLTLRLPLLMHAKQKLLSAWNKLHEIRQQKESGKEKESGLEIAVVAGAGGNMLSSIIGMIVVAMAVATISMTLSKGKVFIGLREWIDNRSDFFGDLIHCPYCTSHWVAFFACLVFQPILITSGIWIFDIILSAFAVTMMASVFSGLIFSSYKQMADPYDEEDE
jgi:hypothetical protein